MGVNATSALSHHPLMLKAKNYYTAISLIQIKQNKTMKPCYFEHLNKYLFFPVFACSSLCVTSEAWDASDHAVGSCLCDTDAGVASSCWRLSPHTPHEVHAAHDERAYWTPIQRGQGTLRWWVVPFGVVYVSLLLFLCLTLPCIMPAVGPVTHSQLG